MAKKKEPVLSVSPSLLIALFAIGVAYAGVRMFLNAEWGRHK